ncbi:hypothetical protein APHAL10511_005562 [Amanita phalloides]|nr:hypothetical protein APHAL10511_005562 [Amanita phalloides]
MSTKSSWEDLAKLGKTKRQIFLTLNAKRGNTMKDESHLHLNDWMADQYGSLVLATTLSKAGSQAAASLSMSNKRMSPRLDNTPQQPAQKEKWTETTTKDSSITVRRWRQQYLPYCRNESKKEDKYEEKHEIKREFEIEYALSHVAFLVRYDA